MVTGNARLRCLESGIGKSETGDRSQGDERKGI